LTKRKQDSSNLKPDPDIFSLPPERPR
jgi:hypothetical protein